MADAALANGTAETVRAALANSDHQTSPFDYWLIEDVLPEWVCDGIAGLPFAPPAAPTFDGRRESNNSTRVYFSPANQEKFDVCRALADAFRSRDVISALEKTTGRNLSNGRLRIEYCQDVDGFWLEPHVDIPVKLLTMLVYLADAPELHGAGTDIFDATPEHRLVTSAPCEWNAGLIFIPGKDTWHGFAQRPIHGVRKSIIINYVTPEWRAAEELA